jgi:hypothetical protein
MAEELQSETDESLVDDTTPVAGDTSAQTGQVDAGQIEGGDESLTQTEQEAAWKAHLKQLGIEDVEDVNVGVERLATAFRQRDSELSEMVEYNRLLESRLRQAPVQQEPEPAEPAAPNDPFYMPQLPMGWEQYRVRSRSADGTEQVVWAEDTPAAIRKAGDEYGVRVREFQYQISTPQGMKELLDSYVAANVLPRVTQEMGAREQQLTVKQVADRFLNENAEWFYETDALTGKALTDQRTGQPKISESGREFQSIMVQLEQDGITNFNRRLEIAQRMFARQQAAAQQEPAQQRQAVQQQIVTQKQALVGRRASTNTTRVPQQQTPAGVRDTQPERRSYGASVVENLRKNGVTLT